MKTMIIINRVHKAWIRLSDFFCHKIHLFLVSMLSLLIGIVEADVENGSGPVPSPEPVQESKPEPAQESESESVQETKYEPEREAVSAVNRKSTDEGHGDRPKKTSVGGQALIEGLLMMGPRNVAIAVRKPDHEIELQVKPLPKKTQIAKIPLIRGVVGLFRQMKIGVGALMYSAEFFDLEEEEGVQEEPSKFDRFLEEKLGEKAKDVIIVLAVILSMGFSVGLFILLPNLIASFLPLNREISGELMLSNLCEGLIRVLLFFGYLKLTSGMKEIRRVWQYHGAEHKTIHCYEHNEELTVVNIQKHTTKHPRCGTSFLFLVMIISILVFSVVDIVMLGLPFHPVGVMKVLFSLAIRLITIPLVAGISYETLKFAGRYDSAFTKAISAPGMLFQRFTTREPDDEMVEVAIVAFNNAMVEDEKEMAW